MQEWTFLSLEALFLLPEATCDAADIMSEWALRPTTLSLQEETTRLFTNGFKRDKQINFKGKVNVW